MFLRATYTEYLIRLNFNRLIIFGDEFFMKSFILPVALSLSLFYV
jgi:hypothetical protein